jgi:TfoX/Sxy family transcriptional regulator of competence genes
MAYDTDLESRIDKEISSWNAGIVKKNMFGGIGYMLNGNLGFGIHKAEMIVRAGEEQSKELLSQPGIRVFDMTGRPMKNWFLAGSKAFENDSDLKQLLELGRDYALSLPPK